MLFRGLTRRCPRCGEGPIFRSWFRPRERCLRCDLRFEQEQGGFLGAMTLNYLFAVFAWLVVLAIVLAFTVPDVPVGPLVAVSVAIMAGVPLLMYPTSKALWAAIEFLVLRSDPDYRTPMRRDPRAGELE